MTFTDDELDQALGAATEQRSWASPAEVAFHLPGAGVAEVVERLAAAAWAEVFLKGAGWTQAPDVQAMHVERVRRRPGAAPD
jgi:hypothetical protein